MESPFLKELTVAINAIQQAARLSEAVLVSKDKGAIEKDDLSPVTIADFAIQALLTTTIHDAFPKDGFVGEESATALRENRILQDRVWTLIQQVRPADDQSFCKLPDSPDRMCDMIDMCGQGMSGFEGAKRVWVFDPIDGTKTFIAGQTYAINVALLQHGQQVLGIVGCPKLSIDATAPVGNSTIDSTGRGCILFAARGYGAYIRPMVGLSGLAMVRKIEPKAESTTLESLQSVSCTSGSTSGVDEVHEMVARRLDVEFPGCDLLAWVLRWVTLALGLAGMTVWVYKKPSRAGKIWDHAGAMLLFEEVGGIITDINGQAIDLTVGRTLSRNHGFVAAPRHLHELVLKTVQQTLRDQGQGHLLSSSVAELDVVGI
jgi:3'(2'), 5'-bisphosphate nucleotidase